MITQIDDDSRDPSMAAPLHRPDDMTVQCYSPSGLPEPKDAPGVIVQKRATAIRQQIRKMRSLTQAREVLRHAENLLGDKDGEKNDG